MKIQPVQLLLKDLRALGKVATHALLYAGHAALDVFHFSKRPALVDQPAVHLERPVVFVPGWSTEAKRFDTITQKLLESGVNGTSAYFVKDGHFFTDPECAHRVERIDPQAKVFVVQFENNRQDPDRTEGQLELAMRSVQTALQVEKLDAVGYSMGGLVSRKYLDEGGRGIGKLMLLATPNHGAPIIQASAWLARRDIHWAMAIAGMKTADLPALEWMTPGSPPLNQLNAHLEAQKQAVEAMETVGADDIFTLSPGALPRRNGDGLVSRDSLELPGVPSKLLRHEGRAQHGEVLNSSQAFAEMRSFFNWQ